MDVNSVESARESIAATRAQHGPVDLVNNAGIECFGSFEEVSIEDFRSVMKTNYFGVLRCVKALVPKILAIAQTDNWHLRHPVGPDAAPTIAWRKGMTDEQWVNLHSADDAISSGLGVCSDGWFTRSGSALK